MISKSKDIPSQSMNDRERLRATEQAFNHQLAQNRQASAQAKAAVRRVRPWWLVGGGLLAGVVVATLPTRAVAAAVGAAAGFAVRLLGTPVGPMAIGAMMGVRQERRSPDAEAPLPAADDGAAGPPVPRSAADQAIGSH
ncbi:MAG: hypothetical protein M0Q42_06595 [Xanthomonadales bacterium]|nr:hypothetical protein [Xanthomonadales bacterium]